MNSTITLTVFTPGEAERITGLTTVMQRDWRRRGFVGASEGHARFNGFDLAEMWALKLLSDRGIGPQHGREVADWLAGGIMLYALQDRRAYEGDGDELNRVPEIDVPDDMRSAIEKAAEKARPGNKFDLSGARLGWLARSNELARRVLQMHDRPKGVGRVMPARFFIWFADGTHRWDETIDECFVSAENGRTAGAVVVLDQFALGKELVSSAGRALVCVQNPDRDTDD